MHHQAINGLSIEYELINYFDRFAVWVDSTVATATYGLWLGLSDDGGSTWRWFGGNAKPSKRFKWGINRIRFSV